MKEHQTLYELLGDQRLLQLLNTFYNKAFSSPVIGPLFNHTQKEVILDKQYCFLTQFLGGPPRYNEKYGVPRMRARHLPHAITPEGRDEWLRIMKESIETLDWDPQLKTALYNCFPQVANHMVNTV
ncbi:MAG: globin [Bacteroidetes bacterium]|nr:globin [Bacteroidota bacterium]